MEPAQTISESIYLKKINELQEDIIELQKSIIEKNQIIEKDKEIIRDLQNKLNIKEQSKYLPTINPIKPNENFDIHKKKVIFKENCQNEVYAIHILQDGRLVSGDASNNIVIYNQKDFKSEMTIKESSYIMFLTQLNNGELVSLLYDGSIKIYKLLDNNKYLTLQTIKEHSARVHKLRMLDKDDNRFMTCSDDCTIKFFFKDKNYYKHDYTFKDDDNIYIFNIIKTRDGEIAYLGYNSNGSFIKFYDLKSRKIISSEKTKGLYNGLTDNLYKLNDTYLLVGASDAILIFDVNQHKQIREIESKNSSCITCFLKWDEKCLLSVDCKGIIKQWIIDEDNLILEKEKCKAHEGQIRMIRKNKDGLIITCSDDKSVKVWN